MNRALIAMLAMMLVGCGRSMRLSARSWDVNRDDGSTIGALLVTDSSLPNDSYDAVAICVTPLNSDPLDSLEALAGACAVGCELLLMPAHSTSPRDQLTVLRRYLVSRPQRSRAVIVIGLGTGCIVASLVAAEEPRVTHVALLGPREFSHDVRQPMFIAEVGYSHHDLPPNMIVRTYPENVYDWRELDTGRTIRPLIEMDLIAWLTQTGALTNERATRLAKRVKANHPEWYSSRSDD